MFARGEHRKNGETIRSTYAVLAPAVRRTAAATLKLTIVANRYTNE